MIYSKQNEVTGVILPNRWSLTEVQDNTALTRAHVHCKLVLRHKRVTHASDCAVLDTQDTCVPGSI